MKTLTIGVPAYNEEQNLGHLLKELQAQAAENYILEKIVIASDGSIDKTVEIAKKFNNLPIFVIDGKERKGVAFRQNEIIEETDSDILIILNADVSIKDVYFIEHIIHPILKDQADLVTPEFKQLLPSSFFERILYRSHELKTAIYEDFHNGKNVYTCCGPARAFSRRLYKKLHFSDSYNEDAYSYMFTTLNGFTYTHIHDTAVYFRLPNNLSDHKNQSTRFFHSRAKLIKEFGQENIQRNYKIPFNIIVNTVKKYASLYPVEISLYVAILAYTCVMAKIIPQQHSDIWQPSKSSKNLNN